VNDDTWNRSRMWEEICGHYRVLIEFDWSTMDYHMTAQSKHFESKYCWRRKELEKCVFGMDSIDQQHAQEVMGDLVESLENAESEYERSAEE